MSHLAMVTKELEHYPFSKGSLLVLYSVQEYHTENTHAFRLRPGAKRPSTLFSCTDQQILTLLCL
jgi:hypothetical protein